MFAHQILNSDFVLLRPSWTVAQALRILNEERTARVILDGRERFLLTLRQVVELLTCFEEAPSLSHLIQDARLSPTPVVDAYSHVENIPESAIIVSDSGVLGFYDISLPAPPALERRSPEARDRESQAQALSVDFPDQVRLGSTHSLLVSIVCAFRERGNLPATATQWAHVEIVIRPRHGFEVLEPSEGVLTPGDGEESAPLQFKLRAAHAGLGIVRVFAFFQGAPLTTLTVTATISEEEAVQGPGSSRETESLLRVRAVPRPDMTVLVLETGGREPSYRILLSAPDPALGLNFTKLGPYPLRRPTSFFEQFYEDLERQPWHRESEWPRIQEYLQEKGGRLSEAFLPSDLERILSRHAGGIGSLQILSEEPWIPWELCFSTKGEEGFLCERFPMTRWVLGISERLHFTFHRLGLVFPSDAGQVHGLKEERFLRLFQESGREIESLAADFHTVRRTLAHGKFDLLHFGTHGSRKRQQEAPCALVCEDGKTLLPTDLTGNLAGVGKTHPFVFMNGCHTARQERTALETTGWPKKFLEVGASAFVGTFWSIADGSAYRFSQAFYSRLFGGQPVAQAMFGARRELQKEGNPSRLAYTVFAHPLARWERETAVQKPRSKEAGTDLES